MSDYNEPNKPSSAEVETSGNYEILNNPKQREVLKRRGIDLVNDSVEADMVIFLDKSARPLAHLYRKIFPVIQPSKPMPKIKFLNIGSEKVMSLSSYAPSEPPKPIESGGKPGAWTGPKVDLAINEINTADDLNYFFGEENVDRLLKVLEVDGKPKKRLIIDDVEMTSRTRTIAERVIAAADRQNGYYDFFTFLEKPEDREHFKVPDQWRVKNNAALPWHGDNGLVEDIVSFEDNLFEADPSFNTRRASDNSGRDYSLRVRKELEMLVDEIKKETS